ncbi:LON peptidase substrate-binding domain-containing protein [Bythopirellula polymerisocia]|uniref:Lon protease n=1 Tax=Bythopirellula polymerisocia TaxID=2528003 RepID=A0A5C6CMM1_9BACT|nr:LON peptidase substrate-binding domain-containing protein [Bythopirellula polymerisocia]TWU25658.1 Lon protease [Bythopirellula polymerisocia]
MVPWNAEDLIFDETRFKGTARLFPLPDLIMFPHVMQPLHIFEPRYRDLLNDALDSDGLIAMCMLAPGWESDYEGNPTLLSHACLGRVVTHQRTDNGEYNILLLGMRRIRIERELPSPRTFRQAEVTLLDDFCKTSNDEKRSDLQAMLTRQFQEFLPQGKSMDGALKEILATEIPLGVLTDLVSFALPMEFQQKRDLLGECDIDKRATMLLSALDAKGLGKSGRNRRFFNTLPPFSAN